MGSWKSGLLYYTSANVLQLQATRPYARLGPGSPNVVAVESCGGIFIARTPDPDCRIITTSRSVTRIFACSALRTPGILEEGAASDHPHPKQNYEASKQNRNVILSETRV